MVSNLDAPMDESGGNFNPQDVGSVPLHVFNLKRDLPDGRDWPLAKLITEPVALPVSDSHLRVMEPPIRNQASLGSCTGFASVRAHRMARRKAGQAVDPELSPLFQYFNEREAMGTIGQDSGASIRQSIQSLKDKGVCDETLWPYILQNWQTRPPLVAYADALLDQAIAYYAVGNDITAIKIAIASGYVVTIGISVYTSFQGGVATSTGDIPEPVPGESLLGGHNIILDTYDDTTGRFGFANSWGTSWGRAGFGTISYAYIQRLGFDGWVIQAVEGPAPVPTPVPTPTPTPTPTPVPVAKHVVQINIDAVYSDGTHKTSGFGV